jgi:ATP-binding cassette, subfamily C (CFTR/MRP), member 1
MVFSDCSGDATFGPAVQGCRDDFDFTLKFEKIFLSLIPASIFVVVSISRSLCLIRKPTLVQGRILQSIKAVSHMCCSVSAVKIGMLKKIH